MKIALGSDIHGSWFDQEGLEYPEADLLVFCGDILGYYARDKRINGRDQLFELEQLDIFFGTLRERYQEIIYIAGNHEFAFQFYPDEARKRITNAVYLQDEELVFNGYKIYGSPWQPWFWDWAFNFPDPNINFFRARAHARRAWEKIPDDVNILITHTPPLNILDETSTGTHVGCQYLGERIDELNHLILHGFGHIHVSRGSADINGVLHVNASNCIKHGDVVAPLTLVEIDEDTDLASII
jgi:Icc-related predicted phosphoesterase